MNRFLKRINFVFCILVLVLALLLSTSVFATDSEVVKVRLAHLFSEGSAHGLKMDWIANELEKRSDGRFECEVFHGGVAGGEKENLEDLLTGNIEIMCGAGSFYYQYVPEANIVELPLYDWESQDQATRIIRGYWDKLVEKSEEKGFFPLALDIRDFFGVWTRNPIQSLKEVEGMKFRSVNADFWIEVTKLFGAFPNPMPMGDFYMAAKTGVVYGGVGPMEPWVGIGMHEILKCFIDVRINLCRSFVLTSVKWINSLPDDLRNIVLEVCEDSEPVHAQILIQEEKKSREKMIVAGVTIIEYDQIDKEELLGIREKGIVFRDRFMEEKGPEVYEFYKDWMEFVEKEKAQ